jgi:D-alanyl-D-alanine carboxypeptidase
MKVHLALIALLLSACGGATASASLAHTREDKPIAAVETIAAPSHTVGPRPGAQAAAPSLIVTPEAADRIDAFLARGDGRAGVVVAGGRSGEILYAADADEPVFAASLYKLGVLLEAERRIDAGTLQPTDLITVTVADQSESGSFTAAGTVLTVDDALERTITLSDNASALALIRTLGIAGSRRRSITSRSICVSPRTARSRQREGSRHSSDSWYAGHSCHAKRARGCWRDFRGSAQWTGCRQPFLPAR